MEQNCLVIPYEDRIYKNKISSLSMNYFSLNMQSFIIDTSNMQYAMHTHFSHFHNKIKDSPLYLSLVHLERGYYWSNNRRDKIRREVLASRRAHS